MISRSFDLRSSTWRSTIFTRFNPESYVDEQSSCNGRGFDANKGQFNSNNTRNDVPDDTRTIDAQEAISLQHVINYGKNTSRLCTLTRKSHVLVMAHSLAQASLSIKPRSPAKLDPSMADLAHQRNSVTNGQEIISSSSFTLSH